MRDSCGNCYAIYLANNYSCVQCRPLIYAAARGSEKIVDLLLTYGANVNQQDRDQSTALIQSCHYNNTPLAKLLVERGANVNKADKVS